MKPLTLHFHQYTITERDSETAPFAASTEYMQWYRSLVATHLSQFMWPNEMVHRMIIASTSENSEAVAFCYYYFDQDVERTELFGTYVEPVYRGEGLARQLIQRAAHEAYSEGCRSFSLPFIEESARDSTFAKGIRRSFPQVFPGAVFHLTFPIEPRVERVGA